MMTGKDCRKEFEKAKKIVKSPEAQAILKTNEVNNKLLLNIRLILDKVREALGINKIVTNTIKQENKIVDVKSNNEDKTDIANK